MSESVVSGAATKPASSEEEVIDALLARVRDEAHTLLHNCISPWGFAASGDGGGYHNLWARDAMITGLGALETEDPATCTTQSSARSALSPPTRDRAAASRIRSTLPTRHESTSGPTATARSGSYSLRRASRTASPIATLLTSSPPPTARLSSPATKTRMGVGL